MARGERRATDVLIQSPELALVDPELRARASIAVAEPEAQRAAPFMDEAARDALRRLSELAEVEPPTRPRSAKLWSMAFATLAWTTLGVLLLDMELWRV
jgi:hypothetical protein